MKAEEAQTIEDAARMLKALSHPIRLKIVCGLAKKENCNVNAMAECLAAAQPTVSQHLNILKTANIIEGCRKANKICYKLKNASVRRLIKTLSADFFFKEH